MKTPTHPLRRRIIWHLRHVSPHTWPTFAVLEAELGEPVEAIRSEVQAMASDGVVRYAPACDDDGRPFGSGYFLSASWGRHRPGRDDDPADDEFEGEG